MWRQIVAHLFHFFAVLLWIAGGLAIVADLPELGVAIFGVIVLNGAFAFVQEHRAEKAAERLREIVPRRSVVVRDGIPREVDAAELVPGDLVVLGGGDRIGADMTAIEAHAAKVDESILTGESVAVNKETGDPLHAGTFFVEGEALGVVAATGAATRLAAVAALTTGVRRSLSPLGREIHRLVRTTAFTAVGVGVAFIGAGLLLGMEPASGLILGIGVMVALVPEALLPTVTLSLAIGAQRMASHHALVRRLEAAETLGSTTFLCTDKTGTLTQNRMAVVEIWTPHGSVNIAGTGYEPDAGVVAESPSAAATAAEVAAAARRCSTGRAVPREGNWVAVGDPMEAALDACARRLGVTVDAADGTEVARYPFDSQRRRMSVMTADHLYVKGAPDAVLPVCRGDTTAPSAMAEALSGRGLRVLAVAGRPVTMTPSPPDAATVERDLEFLGLLGIEDPPRPRAAASVAAIRAAGIKVALVTGDHAATALAIAGEVGLHLPGAPVLTGADLPTDDDQLASVVDHDGVVVSQVTPEDKLRIARALKRKGHVVAMTGDGVNDGPALREADIGIAMGEGGTDVAREAADLVLLDDDLATIITAVHQGRAIFTNARRFLTYHLTDNVAEITPFLIWALSGSRIPLALGVLQILALDLGTDTLSATALGAEPTHRDGADPTPSSGRLLNRAVAFRSFGLLGPVEAAAEMAAFFAVFLAAGWRPGEAFPGDAMAAASGAAFATVVLAQTANAFACRSTTRPAWRVPLSTNRLLLGAAAIELAVAAVFLLAPAVAAVLGHESPSGVGWAVAFASMPLLLAADAAHKWLRRRRDPASGPGLQSAAQASSPGGSR